MTDHPPDNQQNRTQDHTRNHTDDQIDTLLSCCNDTHALLWDYACGTLDNHFALLTEVFLELSADARIIMRQLETIAATMFEHSSTPEKMQDDSLTRVLAAITCPDATAARCHNDSVTSPAPSGRDAATLPAALSAAMHRHLTHNGQPLKWRRIAKGTQACTLNITASDNDSNSALFIFKIEPGASVPHHTHQADEITLIIDGVFTDESGTYGKGDIIIAHENTAHSPAASGNTPCICLMASDAPLHFPRSRTARLLDILGL